MAVSNGGDNVAVWRNQRSRGNNMASSNLNM